MRLEHGIVSIPSTALRAHAESGGVVLAAVDRKRLKAFREAGAVELQPIVHDHLMHIGV